MFNYYLQQRLNVDHILVLYHFHVNQPKFSYLENTDFEFKIIKVPV